MTLTVNIQNNFSVHEVSDIIRSALVMDERIAKHRKAKYANICNNFERTHGMSSDVFLEKFEDGELDDSDDFFDWYAAKRGFDIWNRKLEILSGITL